jgi:transposase-like protein
MISRRKFSKEFKRQVTEDIKFGGISQAQALRKYEISSSTASGWMKQYEQGKFGNEPTEEGALRNKVAELEQMVGQQAMEIKLLKKAKEISQQEARERALHQSLKARLNGGAKS